VYETCEQGVVYVVRPDGSVSLLQGSATIANVPELNVETTIHLFDAKALSNREPAKTLAFLIVTSSRNYRSYAQTSRRVDTIKKCCIPSYTCIELLHYRQLFNVPEHVVVKRCEEIGPSIRYVLSIGAEDASYQQCKLQTETKARSVTTDQLESYMDDNRQAGDSDDISACLLIAIVYEENFVNAEEAYDELNVSWEFGSRNLAKIIMNQIGAKAKSFISHFITGVNRNGITKLKGVAGNFLELIVDEFLGSGKFQKCRRLGEPRMVHATESLVLWNATLQVEEKSIDITTALMDCRDADKLYCYCKIFPAIDYSAMDFRFVFQVTDSPAHTLDLTAIRMICNHVRRTYGEQEKVKLMFVVPGEIASSYQYTQSFKFVGVDEEGVTRKMQAKFEKLDSAIQLELRNLEQWVIYFEKS
jgi:hypothetical protein